MMLLQSIKERREAMRSTRVWSFSLPFEMVRELERIAQQEHRTKSELIREALRRYVEAHHWKHLQREMAARAQHLGITTEEEIERLIDEVRR
jgi:CopG family transcriptional regulator/antitoxin EndoAI